MLILLKIMQKLLKIYINCDKMKNFKKFIKKFEKTVDIIFIIC